MNNYFIKKPVITEKSFAASANGVYTFVVDKAANKHEVAKDVHKLFKVDVVDVRIINTPGKVKRSGRKYGKRSDIKKALVKVKKGQTISIFETDDKNADKQDKKNKKVEKKDKKPEVNKLNNSSTSVGVKDKE